MGIEDARGGLPQRGAVKGLLFDKDGTLIDFFATWLPAFCDAADAVAPGDADRLLRLAGYDRAADRLDPDSVLAGGTNEELVALWREALGARAPDDLAGRVDRAFARHATGDVVPIAELRPLMEGLRARGLALGMATNDDTASARWTVRHLGVADLMDFVCGADAGHGGKPGPGMGLAFCAAAGIAPGEAAMVGDSAADAGMARAAGFAAAIGVCTGAAARAQLLPWFDAVIDSVADLPALLFDERAP